MIKPTLENYPDHGMMPYLWYLPAGIVMVLGLLLESPLSQFIIISVLISLALGVSLVVLNGWSKVETPAPFSPAIIKINPFKIPFALGAFTSITIVFMVWPRVLHVTDTIFFAGITGALACLAGLMLVGEDFT
jgi:hypothetical protein